MANAVSSLRDRATRVLKQLRSGIIPGEDEAVLLNQVPLIHELREQVTEKDIPMLLDIVDRYSGAIAGFALSLLRHFCVKNNNVKEKIRKRWEAAEPYLRCYLFWRILDDGDLPDEWHKELFAFVLESWDIFQDQQSTYFGGENEVLKAVLRRIGDADYSISKKWSYICCLPDLVDEDVAKSIILLFRNQRNNSEFNIKVADELLNRLASRKWSYSSDSFISRSNEKKK